MKKHKLIEDAENNWPEDEAAMLNCEVMEAIEAGYDYLEIERHILDLPRWLKIFEDDKLFNRFVNSLDWDFNNHEPIVYGKY